MGCSLRLFIVVSHQREIGAIAGLLCMLGITKWASENGNLERNNGTHAETWIEGEVPDEDPRVSLQHSDSNLGS